MDNGGSLLVEDSMVLSKSRDKIVHLTRVERIITSLF